MLKNLVYSFARTICVWVCVTFNQSITFYCYIQSMIIWFGLWFDSCVCVRFFHFLSVCESSGLHSPIPYSSDLAYKQRTSERTCVLSPIQLFAFYHSISGWNCIRVIDNKQSNKQNEAKRWSFFPVFVVWCSRKMAFHVPSLLFCVHQCFLSIINSFFPISRICFFYVCSRLISYSMFCEMDVIIVSHRHCQLLICLMLFDPFIYMSNSVQRFFFFSRLSCPFVWSKTHYRAAKSVTSWRCGKGAADDTKMEMHSLFNGHWQSEHIYVVRRDLQNLTGRNKK